MHEWYIGWVTHIVVGGQRLSMDTAIQCVL